MNTRCEHGLSGDLDANGNPRCQLCRFLIGALVVTGPPTAADDRCHKPGHELARRQNCPACASERAEQFGSIETRQTRAELRQIIRRPTDPNRPTDELAHSQHHTGSEPQ